MKKRRSNLLTGILMALIACLLFCCPVMAEESRQVIGEVNIYLEYSYSNTSVQKPNVIANSSLYNLAPVNWAKDNYAVGEKAVCELTFFSSGNYQFTEGTSINVTGGTYLSTITNTNDQLVITIQTQSLGKIFSGPSNVRWSKEDYGKAIWDEDSDAEEYEVRYRNKVYTTSKCYFNFHSKLNRDYDTFEVRSIPKENSSWKESEWITSNSITWNDGNDNYENDWNNNDYRYDHNWNLPSNNWYHQSGWVQRNDNWYFIFNGYNVTDWWNVNGTWYFFRENGKMVTGFIEVANEYYYLHTNGSMAANEWIQLNNDWYYFGPSGAAVGNQWILYNSKWYYLRDNRKMAYNTWIGPYYVGQDGAMLTNTWVGSYYVGPDGTLMR